jgi:hypothetical protein
VTASAVQLALRQQGRQPLQRHQALQQAGQRRVVQQRAWLLRRQRAITQPTDSMVSQLRAGRMTPMVSAR